MEGMSSINISYFIGRVLDFQNETWADTFQPTVVQNAGSGCTISFAIVKTQSIWYTSDEVIPIDLPNSVREEGRDHASTEPNRRNEIDLS